MKHLYLLKFFIFLDPAERLIINKERLGGYYRLSAYFFARLSVDIPLSMVLPTFITAILLGISGLNPVFLTNVRLLFAGYLGAMTAGVSLSHCFFFRWYYEIFTFWREILIQWVFNGLLSKLGLYENQS